MDIAKADIVLSLAGRDKGKLFFVTETAGEYAFLANGKERKIEFPKRKKLNHVRRVTRTDSLTAQAIKAGGKVLNSELRRELAKCRQNMSQNQGG